MDILLVGYPWRKADWTTHMGVVYGWNLRIGHPKRLVCTQTLLVGNLRDEETELLCGVHHQWLGCLYVWKRFHSVSDAEYGDILGKYRSSISLFCTIRIMGAVLSDLSGAFFEND